MFIGNANRVTFSTPVPISGSVAVSNFPSPFDTIDQHHLDVHYGVAYVFCSPVIAINANSSDTNYWFENTSTSTFLRLNVISRNAQARYQIWENITSNENALTTICRNRLTPTVATTTFHNSAWQDGTMIYERIWNLQRESATVPREDEEWIPANDMRYGLALINDSNSNTEFQFIANWQER